MRIDAPTTCRFTGKMIPALEVDPTWGERRDGRFPDLLIREAGRLPGVIPSGELASFSQLTVAGTVPELNRIPS